jgi:plastocyanin
MHSYKPKGSLATLITCVILVGCGGDDGPSEPTDGGADATVAVENNLFSPSAVSVPINGTVTWQWNSGGVAHNVTFADGAPGSGDRSSGTFERLFSTPGAFNYQCTIHPGMAGRVDVASSGGGGGGGDEGGDPDYGSATSD